MSELQTVRINQTEINTNSTNLILKYLKCSYSYDKSSFICVFLCLYVCVFVFMFVRVRVVLCARVRVFTRALACVCVCDNHICWSSLAQTCTLYSQNKWQFAVAVIHWVGHFNCFLISEILLRWIYRDPVVIYRHPIVIYRHHNSDLQTPIYRHPVVNYRHQSIDTQ